MTSTPYSFGLPFSCNNLYIKIVKAQSTKGTFTYYVTHLGGDKPLYGGGGRVSAVRIFN